VPVGREASRDRRADAAAGSGDDGDGHVSHSARNRPATPPVRPAVEREELS
jgi:hypothetical protein